MRLRPFHWLTAVGLAISVLVPNGAALGTTWRSAAGHEAAGCSLVPEGSNTEFASCLRVTAALDRAPALGATATLSVRIDAERDLGRVRVRVDVPTGLAVTSGPGVDGPAVRAPGGSGKVVPRTAVITPGAGSETLRFRVRASQPGPASIEVRATAVVDAGFTDGALASVPVTVAGEGGTSRLSIAHSTRGGTVPASGTPSSAEPDPNHRAAPVEVVAPHGGAAPTGGAGLQSCISGRWGYDHPTLGYTGVPNYAVQIWDEDDFSADDLLASGVTTFDGSYELCYTDTDGFGEGQDAQEVYVLYVSENSVWRVRDDATNDQNYENQSSTVSVAEGNDHDYGDVSPANNIDRGIHAFHAVDKLWQWGVDPNGLCFDWGAVTCRQLTVNWTATSSDGTYYSLSGNDVHLVAADPDSETQVIHEATHAVMDDVYNDSFPPAASCVPHVIQNVTSTGCAWTEGFAEWVPAAVLDDPFYRWPSGAFLNLENVDVNSAGWSDGDTVEGRVAGAMIDIQDTAVANLDFFDFWSETDMDQYEAFQDFATVGNGIRPATYNQFWADRAALGLNAANTGANGSNNQNTINYGFVAPTCNGTTVTRFGTHNADVINGTSSDDVIYGLAGDDTIDGLGGEDLICGGYGNDDMEGGALADELRGGPGDDTIAGQDGADAIYGLEDDDTINGGIGADVIEGGPGDDTLDGEEGNDEVRGLGGVDVVDGGPGADGVGGGAGSPDDCDGGAGGSDTHLGGCEILTGVP
jgi:Ca2+-binding RTX toxin-like protein